MKKLFITAISQERAPFSALYRSENENLRNDRATPWPIFNVLANQVDSLDDELEMIAIMFPGPGADASLGVLKECIADFEKERGVSILLTVPEHWPAEAGAGPVALLGALLEKIPDRCEIYADITYGTGPVSVGIFAALACVNILRVYAGIEQIVYGRAESWKTIELDNGEQEEVPDIANIYDITQLLSILSLTEHMSALGGEGIEEAVKLLVNL